MLTVNLDQSSVMVAIVGVAFCIMTAVRALMVMAIVLSRCLA